MCGDGGDDGGWRWGVQRVAVSVLDVVFRSLTRSRTHSPTHDCKTTANGKRENNIDSPTSRLFLFLARDGWRQFLSRSENNLKKTARHGGGGRKLELVGFGTAILPC